MTTALVVLLFINAAFNFAVWPQFLGRVAKDARARDEHGRPTRFLLVHIVLITIALVIGLVSLLLGIVTLVGGY